MSSTSRSASASRASMSVWAVMGPPLPLPLPRPGAAAPARSVVLCAYSRRTGGVRRLYATSGTVTRTTRAGQESGSGRRSLVPGRLKGGVTMAVSEPLRLTTGWKPDVPVGDTMLRRFVTAWAESLAGPIAAVGGHVEHRDGLVVGDLARPAAYYNGAMLLRPAATDAWAVLVDEVEEQLPAGPGTGDIFLWSAWRPLTCGAAAGSWRATRRFCSGRPAVPYPRLATSTCDLSPTRLRSPPGSASPWKATRWTTWRRGSLGAVRPARACDPAAAVGGVCRRAPGWGRRLLCRPWPARAGAGRGACGSAPPRILAGAATRTAGRPRRAAIGKPVQRHERCRGGAERLPTDHPLHAVTTRP